MKYYKWSDKGNGRKIGKIGNYCLYEKEITEENLRNVLTAAGVSIDEARLKSLVESLKDINIDDLQKEIAAGMKEDNFNLYSYLKRFKKNIK